MGVFPPEDGCFLWGEGGELGGEFGADVAADCGDLLIVDQELNS